MPIRNPFKKKKTSDRDPTSTSGATASSSTDEKRTPLSDNPPWIASSSTEDYLHGGSGAGSGKQPDTPTTVGSDQHHRSPTTATAHSASDNYVQSFDIEHNLSDENEQRNMTQKQLLQQQQQQQEQQQQQQQQPYKQQDFGEVNDDYNLVIDGKPVYIVKQKRGYLSIGFSVVQTVIMIAMMVQCSIAPLKINPMIGPYPDALSYWGGKNAYEILYDHEYWRLFSPILLHAGIFHLLCNISVQLDTGAFFEREWGSVIFLIIYLGSAAAGSILSVIVSPNSVGVGSSGSVCGLFGAKIAEALCRSRESTKTNQRELSHAILCEQFGSTLCSVILILVFSFIPYVDWAAHIGGLLGGFVFGLMIFAWQVKTFKWKFGLFVFGFVFALIGFSLGTLHMIEETKLGVAEEMGDVCGYYMKFFEDYECNCMLERHQNQD